MVCGNYGGGGNSGVVLVVSVFVRFVLMSMTFINEYMTYDDERNLRGTNK